jgi:hypothetical protein
MHGFNTVFFKRSAAFTFKTSTKWQKYVIV